MADAPAASGQARNGLSWRAPGGRDEYRAAGDVPGTGEANPGSGDSEGEVDSEARRRS